METYVPTAARRTIPEDARLAVARVLWRHYEELAGTEEADAPPFSFSRLVEQMKTPRGLVDGREREICSSTATLAGEHFDPHRVLIPLHAIRDLTAASAAGGGFLVGSSIANAEPFDVLRPYSVAVEAGMTVIPGLQGNVTLTRITTAAGGGWIATESTNLPTAQPVLGQVAMTPKFVAGWVNISRNMTLQAASLEAMLRQQLLGAVGQLLDAAVFSGSGTAGQPTGLHMTPGINTTSGTSLAHAGVLAMRRQVLAAGGRQNRLRWIGTPAVQELLGARERATGGGRFLWDDDGILGAPASATSNAPTGALTVGDWSQAVLGVWGPPALRVEIDPYTGFKSGAVAARVILACDLAFPQPSAFSVAGTVT
ncbi:phage major capsid protein [uncultured Piscinibacter sp.]|uniref:phage major capsid protein n=1 Tax=uncultured Piscinibacter sp. TaxID=1131835 RepID=UPI002615BDA7|nr:phage major capsid protein [uncultured Piscinibacter sp.]